MTDRVQSTIYTEKPDLSVVIPTYLRAAVLRCHIQRIVCCLEKAELPGNGVFEIILVDDASPDGTRDCIRSLVSSDCRICGLVLKNRTGQQNATLAGIRQARGDIIVTMDDDGKDQPEEIQRLLSALISGYDIVYGVSEQRSQSILRRLGTTVKEHLIGRLCQKPAGIRLTAFRAMNRTTADRVTEETRRRVYISATILQYSLRIGSVTVRESLQNTAVSGYSMCHLLRVLTDLFIEYGSGPLSRLFRRHGSQYVIGEVIECG